jgi:prepilin peptidase CpaA
MVATVCLWGLMIVATVTDVRQQKIYNWTTYSGIGLALLLASLESLNREKSWSEIEINDSLMGLLTCGGIMLVCFVLFQIGGGDVKLLAMVGAFLGTELGIETLLWTFVIGAASAAIILIWKIGIFSLSKRVIHQLMCKLGLGQWDELSENERTQLKLPLFLAPAASIAVLIVKMGFLK